MIMEWVNFWSLRLHTDLIINYMSIRSVIPNRCATNRCLEYHQIPNVLHFMHLLLHRVFQIVIFKLGKGTYRQIILVL